MNWIDANDLHLWASRRDSQAQLPRVVRRLVHATVERPAHVDFPAGEGVQLGGWDGIVEVHEGDAFVPHGVSGWEMSVRSDVKAKADKDYKKRSEDPLELDPAISTFVFVTARRWKNKREWAADRLGEGLWADVRAYDADDLEQWLELAPAVQAWLSLLLGKRPGGAQDLGDFWDEWRLSTAPPISADLVLAGRQDAFDRIASWLEGPPSVLALQADSRDESVSAVAAALFKMAEEIRLPYLARSLIARDEQAWQHMLPNTGRLILIPGFPDPPGTAKAVFQGHHVMIPLGKESTAFPGTLKLARAAQAEFSEALRDMGMDEDRAVELRACEMIAGWACILLRTG